MRFIGDKQHFWTSICDDRGNQIKDFIECDRCGIVCHSYMVQGETGTIKPEYRRVIKEARWNRLDIQELARRLV